MNRAALLVKITPGKEKEAEEILKSQKYQDATKRVCLSAGIKGFGDFLLGNNLLRLIEFDGDREKALKDLGWAINSEASFKNQDSRLRALIEGAPQGKLLDPREFVPFILSSLMSELHRWEP